MPSRIDVTVLAGDGWCEVVKKGETLRIVDLEGNQAVDTLLYNAHDKADRYSAIDTIAAQTNLYLTKGSKLLTQNGNVLMTIVEDQCGDTLRSRIPGGIDRAVRGAGDDAAAIVVLQVGHAVEDEGRHGERLNRAAWGRQSDHAAGVKATRSFAPFGRCQSCCSLP